MISIKTISPMKELKDALDVNMKPKMVDVRPVEVLEPSAEVLSGPVSTPLPLKGAGDSDKQMVLNRLRSINRMSEILEKMACGCEPMPSWAEAKVYSAAKDLQGVLGYLLGK